MRSQEGRREPVVEIISVAERPSLWLEPGIKAVLTGRDLTLEGDLSVRPREVGGPIETMITLEVQGEGITPGTLNWTEKVELRGGPRLHPFSKIIHLPAGANPLSVRSSESGNSISLVSSSRPGASVGDRQIVAHLVALPAEAARWQATLQALRSNPAFDDWRQRMSAWDVPFNPDDLELTTVPPPRKRVHVVVEVGDPSRVWVHPEESGVSLPTPRKVPPPSVTASSDKPRPNRGAVTGDSIPGQYSFENLPLNATELAVLDDPTATTVALRRLLYSELDSGDRALTSPPIAIGSRWRTVDTSGLGFRATLLGLGPSSQQVLLDSSGNPPPGFELARCSAYWANLLDAVRVAADRDPPSTVSEAVDGEMNPVALVDSDHLSLARSSALVLPLAILIVGLALYAIVVLCGIRAANSIHSRTSR